MVERVASAGYIGKRNAQAGLEAFHARHKDVAVAINVTRRPYSFAGANRARAEDGSWLWKDGLDVYAGDQLQQQMLMSGVSRKAVAALRSAEPWTACRPYLPELTDALENGKRMGLPGTAELLALITKSPEEPAPAPGVHAKGKITSPADVVAGAQARASIGGLGERAGIKFDFNTEFTWHPVESQRLLLWATRLGKAEELMTELNKRHFERRQSVNARAALLEAVEATEGLDVAAASAFLDTNELEDEVWESYYDTIERKQIHAIPYFSFMLHGRGGGPFRDGPGPEVSVRGSANAQTFLETFDTLWKAAQRQQTGVGANIAPDPRPK